MNRVKKLNRQRGMTVIELMVVVVVMGIVAMAMSQILWDSKKFQSHIELKTETVDIKNSIALSTRNTEACREALFIDGEPTVFDQAKIPYYDGGGALQCPGGNCDKTYPIDLKKVKVLGHQTYVASENPIPESKLNHRLNLNAIRFDFRQPTGKTGDSASTYIVNLTMVYGKLAETASLGSSTMVTKLPLLVKLEPQGANQFVVKDCYLDASTDPETTCKKMGGTWLSNTNNKNNPLGVLQSECPKTNINPNTGRCVFSNSYPLETKEIPDGISCLGDKNDLNERPQYCFGIPSGETKVKQIACPAKAKTTNGKKCVYKNGDWWFVKQKKPNIYVDIMRCSEGIQITKAAEGKSVKSWDEAPAPEEQYYATRCLYDMKNELFKECKNDNEKDVDEYDKNTCVFVAAPPPKRLVDSGPVYDATKRRVKYCEKNLPGECPSSTPANYHGWTFITHIEKDAVGNVIKAKSRGIPCFEVEIVPD